MMNYRNGDSSSAADDRAARIRRGEVCAQFMDKLQTLQEAGHMCDLVFELRGQQFLAHRVVVSAWSPLVYNLCSKDTVESQRIRVHYDNLDVFASFLAFLYAGRMNAVAEDNLIQVLHLATSLQVNGLRQTCEEALKQQLHIGNIISTFHVARKFRLPNLEEFALNFMQMNLPEAVKQADFLSLTPSRFNSFLSSGWVCVMKPEVKLFLIISWLGYDVKERQQYLVLLLKYIDWSVVANDFLLEISQTENFFTTNESSLYLLLQTLFSSTIPLGPYTDLFPGLRERYGYLLEYIVQNSYVLPLEPEEYFPVTFCVVSEPAHSSSHPTASDDVTSASQRNVVLHNRNEVYDASNDEYFADFPEIFYGEAELNTSVSVHGRAVRIDSPSKHRTATQRDKTMVSKDRKVVSKGKTIPSKDKKMPSKDKKKTPKAKGKKTAHKKETVAPKDNSPVSAVDRTASQTPPQTRSMKRHSPDADVSPELGSLRRKRLRPRKLDQTPPSVSTPPKQTQEHSPSKVRGGGETKTKGPLTLKYKECQKLEQKQNVAETKDTKTTDSNSGSNATANSVIVQNMAEMSSAPNTRSSPLRLKRKAAAKFSVPEKLLPRRKTKAALKQQVARKPQQAKVLQVEERLVDIGAVDGDDEELEADEIGAQFSDGVRGRQASGAERNMNPLAHAASSSINRTNNSTNDSMHKGVKEKTLDKTVHETVGAYSNLSTQTQNVFSATWQGANQRAVQQHKEESSAQASPTRQGKVTKNKCEECNYIAPSSKRLVKHRMYVHGGTATLYTCTICEYQCRWNRHYYTHMRQHFSGPPFICDTEGCGYAADRIQILLTHRRKHTDERPFKCGVCSASFRTRNNMHAHYKCHSDEKKYECPVCRRRFKMKNTLDQHLVTHSADRPYLCDTCGFSTKFQSHLIAHKRLHTGNVFHCSFPKCTYYSPKRSQLKAHMRSHLNLRTHQCRVCEKTFMEKSHLVRHLKIHQEDRPHRCEMCEYNSTRQDKLREHINKHHGDDASVKKKWQPRKKPVKKSSSAATTSTSSPAPKRGKSASVVTAPLPRENPWVEASLATLVSAAEEVRLAEGSLESNNSGVLTLPLHSDGRGGVHTVPLQSLEDSGMHSSAASGGQVVMMNPVVHAGTVTMYSDGDYMHKGNNHNRSMSVPVSSHTAHPMALQQQHMRSLLPQHTSATLLQQLAMSVSSSSAVPQRHYHQPLVTSADLNTHASYLPHTASPDVPSASQILLNAMQQHATATAADGLASLSCGVGPSMLHGQNEGGPYDVHHGLHNSTLANLTAVNHASTHLHQHQHQSHGQKSEGQHQDYNGLNAFMALF